MEYEMNSKKKTYTAPKIEKLVFETANIITASGGGDAGNDNVGSGRGRGGGCDGLPYHRNPRTFSSGRNSGC